MRLVSLRRAVPAGMAAAAALAMGLPGMASAKSTWKTDIYEKCTEGASVKAEGSTFAAPAEYVFTGFNGKENKLTGGGYNVAKGGCTGGGAPTVRYEQSVSNMQGSGSCLKTWGNGFTSRHTAGSESQFYPRVAEYPLCGTDEAPTKTVKEEFELFQTGGTKGNGEAIESIPVAQGAVAMIVHLPKSCTVEATAVKTDSGKKTITIHRFALDQKTIKEIYEGKIKTWPEAAAAVKAEGGPENKLKCTEDENETIHVVVRHDKSGTTHIFKSFLAQVQTEAHEANVAFETYEHVNGTEAPCKAGPNYENEQTESWEAVQEGCQNQRWPAAANVTHASASGNGGVIAEVNTKASSIGYADLAFAVEEKYFNTAEQKGGESGKKEFNEKFWAVVQSNEPGSASPEYEDPSTKGDTEKPGESNCKDAVYTANIGEVVPPVSTRSDWSKVKESNTSKDAYSICGLTYVIAARQYFYYLAPYFVEENPAVTTTEEEAKSKAIATTVHDYLKYVVSTKGGGGGKELKDHYYEALPKAVAEKAAKGAEEIGSKISEEV